MNRAAHAKGRELRPLPELVEMVSEVSGSIDALCEVLRLADSNKVFAISVYTLLEPLRAKLCEASCDLNDTRI